MSNGLSKGSLLYTLFLLVCHGIFGGCRKGDYYRYLAEFKIGNDRKEVADHSMKAYQVGDLSLLPFIISFLVCVCLLRYFVVG